MNKNQLNWRLLGGVAMMVGALSACEHLPGNDRPIVQNMEEQDGQAQPDGRSGALAAIQGTPAATAPAPAGPVLAPASRTQTSSRIDEVRHMIQNRQVRELRTTYNGNYGSSLLFQPDSLQYYAVLFENRNVWRVVKTDDGDKAEKAYRDYVGESAQLAKAELDRIQFEAQYHKAERDLLDKADELTSLQRDIEIQEQQDMLIKSQQAQLRSEAERLAQQQQEAQEQLTILQRQIEALQRQSGTRP